MKTTTPQQELDRIAAGIDELQREIDERRAAVDAAQRAHTLAQQMLANQLACGRGGDVNALGEAMLRQQEAAVAVETAQQESQPLIADAERQIAALQAQAATVQKKIDQDAYSALVIEYERLAAPLWALSDRIRAQAEKCGVPIEADGGALLDRRKPCIGGYPLRGAETR